MELPLQDEGIEYVLRHRGKGLFGDALMDGLTWICVPERDYVRAVEMLYPVQDPEAELELQCPICRSPRVKYDITSHKHGLGKIIIWPWDKERFFYEDCKHVWDREPEVPAEAASDSGPSPSPPQVEGEEPHRQ